MNTYWDTAVPTKRQSVHLKRAALQTVFRENMKPQEGEHETRENNTYWDTAVPITILLHMVANASDTMCWLRDPSSDCGDTTVLQRENMKPCPTRGHLLGACVLAGRPMSGSVVTYA